MIGKVVLRLLVASILLVACFMNANASNLSVSGLRGRTIAGYQGWFGCPGDFEDNRVWQHWFVRDVKSQNLTVDLLPDTSQLEDKDLCDTGLTRADGKGTVKVFSSMNPAVVRSHMASLRRAGIDGVALQRFVGGLTDPHKLKRMDQVLRNVLSATEANGRVFYITYDVSGAAPAEVVSLIQSDWQHLQQTFDLSSSAAYLKEDGRPILQLWGFGFEDRPGEPSEVLDLIRQLKQAGNFVIGGVPTHWRTLDGDSKNAPGWAHVYRSYDAISPWTVGRFSDAASADAFARQTVMPDIVEARKAGVRYIPVVFPGFSWFNLMNNRGHTAILNQIPRECGRFLQRQTRNMLKLRTETLYVAMADEFDEATAILPGERSTARTPTGAHTLAETSRECDGPRDRYLQVVGTAAALLREGRRVKE